MKEDRLKGLHSGSFHFDDVLEKAKLISVTEIRWGLRGAGGWKAVDYKGHEGVSGGGDTTFLDPDCDAGYTTACICRNSEQHGKRVHFTDVGYISTHLT